MAPWPPGLICPTTYARAFIIKLIKTQIRIGYIWLYEQWRIGVPVVGTKQTTMQQWDLNLSCLATGSPLPPSPPRMSALPGRRVTARAQLSIVIVLAAIPARLGGAGLAAVPARLGGAGPVVVPARLRRAAGLLCSCPGRLLIGVMPESSSSRTG